MEASPVWQTSDTKEQVNERTKERVWINHVPCLAMFNVGLRKLLTCNSYTSVEETYKVDGELHTSYTRTMGWMQFIDIKRHKFYVTTE